MSRVGRVTSPSGKLSVSSADGFIGVIKKQGPRFTEERTPGGHVAVSPEIGIGAGDGPENLLEDGFVTGDGERAVVDESVLFLRFQQKLLEDRMVQVSGADDESSGTAADTDGDVAGGDVGGSGGGAAASGGGDASLLAPALEHLADADDAADVVGFSDSGRHFLGKVRENREEEEEGEGEVCWEVGESVWGLVGGYEVGRKRKWG